MVLSLVERLVTVIARTRVVVLVLADGSPSEPRYALELRELQHAEPLDLTGECELENYKLPHGILHST